MLKYKLRYYEQRFFKLTKNTFINHTLTIIAAIILTLISMLPIGILGVVVSALLASTIGYSVTKHHYSFVGVVCICVFLVYLIFSKDFALSTAASLPLILCGITLGITYNLKFSEFTTISVICGIYTIYLLLNIKILGASGNDFFENVFSLSAQDYSEMIMSLYPDQFTQAEIDALISNAMSVMMKFMPSFTIIMCALMALLMFYVFKKVLSATKKDMSFYKPFSDWHADKSFGIIFFVILVISFFLPEQSYISDAIANVVFISLFVFYIFGLSLTDFLLKRKISSTFLRRSILILLVLFTFGTLMFAICFLGAIDSCADFRKKLQKNNLPEQE